MPFSLKTALAGSLVFLALASFVIWPTLDISISSLFVESDKGFYWINEWPLRILSKFAFYGARVLGAALAVCAIAAYIRRRDVLGLHAKSWLFLFVGLLVGPGLVANVIFKDNWGRARPRMVEQFGGEARYTPPLAFSDACQKNCSFVSGDAAFGFYFTAFAYVAPLRRSRRFFWGGMALGFLFGGARLVSGAHFMSDVLYAAVFILPTIALCHALLFGKESTRQRWRAWLSAPWRALP